MDEDANEKENSKITARSD